MKLSPYQRDVLLTIYKISNGHIFDAIGRWAIAQVARPEVWKRPHSRAAIVTQTEWAGTRLVEEGLAVRLPPKDQWDDARFALTEEGLELAEELSNE